MVLWRWCESSGLVGARVSGAVTETDRLELTAFVKAAVERFGEVRILVGVEGYVGRHHDARFDPDALWNGRNGKGISKVAVVGEPAWKVIAPAASKDRQVPIQYFANEYAARRWLAGGRIPDASRRPSKGRRESSQPR